MLSIKYKDLYSDLMYGTTLEMSGGSRPKNDILLDINLFSGEMRQYLDPVYGFIWTKTHIIRNYMYIMKSFVSTSKMSRACYFDIPNNVQPIRPLFEFTTNRELGKYLGYKYKYLKTHKTNVDKLQIIINNIDKYVKIIKTIETDKDKLLQVSAQAKIGLQKGIDNKLKLVEDILSNNNESIKSQFPIPFTSDIDSILKAQNSLDAYSTIIKNHIESITVTFSDNIMTFIDKHWTDDLHNYHLVLSIIWWKATNKAGIKEYYEGVNESLSVDEQIQIPEDFNDKLVSEEILDHGENIEFDEAGYDRAIEGLNKRSRSRRYGDYDSEDNEINEYDFTQSIPLDFYSAIAHAYNNEPFIFNEQEYAYLHNTCDKVETFADCGASTLRSFMRILILNKDRHTYNIDILRDFDAYPMLIEYFETFDNETLQHTKIIKRIFGQNLIARDAWALVTMNHKTIQYINKCTCKDNKFNYEINSGYPNMLNLIKILLPGSSTEKYKKYGMTIGELYNTYGDHHEYGDIDFKNDVGSFTMHNNEQHYHITSNINKINGITLFTHFTEEQSFLIQCIATSPFMFNSLLKGAVYRWYMFIDFWYLEQCIEFSNIQNPHMDSIDNYDILYKDVALNFFYGNSPFDNYDRFYRFKIFENLLTSDIIYYCLANLFQINNKEPEDKPEKINSLEAYTNLKFIFDKTITNMINKIKNLQKLTLTQATIINDITLISSINVKELEISIKYVTDKLVLHPNVKSLIITGYNNNNETHREITTNDINNIIQISHKLERIGFYYYNDLIDLQRFTHMQKLEIGYNFKLPDVSIFNTFTNLEELKIENIIDASQFKLPKLKKLLLNQCSKIPYDVDSEHKVEITMLKIHADYESIHKIIIE